MPYRFDDFMEDAQIDWRNTPIGCNDKGELLGVDEHGRTHILKPKKEPTKMKHNVYEITIFNSSGTCVVSQKCADYEFSSGRCLEIYDKEGDKIRTIWPSVNDRVDIRILAVDTCPRCGQ